MNNWKDVSDELPIWDDGEVAVKFSNGTEGKAIFNELADWWRFQTPTGTIRVDLEDEVITHWKPLV